MAIFEVNNESSLSLLLGPPCRLTKASFAWNKFLSVDFLKLLHLSLTISLQYYILIINVNIITS